MVALAPSEAGRPNLVGLSEDRMIRFSFDPRTSGRYCVPSLVGRRTRLPGWRA